MEYVFDNKFSKELYGVGYKSNEEYILDEIKIFEMMLFYYETRFVCGDMQSIKEIALSDYKKSRDYVMSRVKHADKEAFFAAEYIKKLYDFSDLEWFLLICSIAVKYEPNLKVRILKAFKSNSLDYSHVFKIYYFVNEVKDIENYYDIYCKTFEKMNLLCFNNGNNFEIDDRLYENIMSNARKKIDLLGVRTRLPSTQTQNLTIHKDSAQRIINFLNNKPKNSEAFCYICGQSGIGKHELIEYVCDVMGMSLVCFDFSKYSDENSKFVKNFFSACREASFLSGFLCLENIEEFNGDSKNNDKFNIEPSVNIARKFSNYVFILSKGKDNMPEFLRDMYSMKIKLENLNSSESYEIWKKELKGKNIDKNVDIHELANKFNLTPAQIRRAISQSVIETSSYGEELPITSEQLSVASYSQITQDFEGKATVIKKKHKWEELILPKEQKQALQRACNQIKYKHVVYDEWGLKKSILYGRGLSMLFTGPPGTGKTMAAQVVANELKLEIYRVDISQVVSKYIGETEKNLSKIFDSAKKSNVILLFDETDAIFGKRTEVKDSHDKNANLETAYLLQKMEEYDGMTIMTTNLVENLDPAFFRRITYVIPFPIPDAQSRKKIWKNMYPKQAPLSSDVDFDYLANNFEVSGGNIKNIVITSTFMAASESKKIEMKHIIKGVEYELKKQGKMVSKSDFGEYGYLI